MSAAAQRQRRDLVDEAVIDVGQRWVEFWHEELRKQSRPAEGGWPGTMREARARIAARVDPALAQRRMQAMTIEELGDAARATYRKARRDWLAAPALQRERMP